MNPMTAAWEQLPAGHPIDDGWCKARVLGAGGMSVVLEVHKAPNFVDAIKIFAGDDLLESRFAEECALTVALAHPHIVAVKDCRVLPEGLPSPKGTPYVRMERLHGVTVRELLEEARAKSAPVGQGHGMGARRVPVVRPARIFRIVEEAAAALAFAHERGIVHCDIKPENLFLHQPPHLAVTQVKLLDFGIAEACAAERRRSEKAFVVGTPRYLPPEAVGAGGVFAKPAPLRDIYALAMVLYELLTLQRSPWPIDITTRDDILRAHGMPPAAPSFWVAGLGPEIDEVVLRALSPNPAHRLQSLGELVEGLRGLLALDAASDDVATAAVATDPEPAVLAARLGALDAPAPAPSAAGTWIEQARRRQLSARRPRATGAGGGTLADTTDLGAPHRRGARLWRLLAATAVAVGALGGGGFWAWAHPRSQGPAPSADALDEVAALPMPGGEPRELAPTGLPRSVAVTAAASATGAAREEGSAAPAAAPHPASRPRPADHRNKPRADPPPPTSLEDSVLLRAISPPAPQAISKDDLHRAMDMPVGKEPKGTP